MLFSFMRRLLSLRSLSSVVARHEKERGKKFFSRVFPPTSLRFVSFRSLDLSAFVPPSSCPSSACYDLSASYHVRRVQHRRPEQADTTASSPRLSFVRSYTHAHARTCAYARRHTADHPCVRRARDENASASGRRSRDGYT